MAVNPLFQTYKHREKCISQVRKDILISQVKSLLPFGMAQQRSRASPAATSSDGEPTQAKRPRLDEPVDEEWDDDFVLTQEILDITESQGVAGPSTSRGPSSAVPVSSASGRHTFQIPASSASVLGSSRLKNQSSTSSSDSSSIYPQSSASLRRTASSDVSSGNASMSDHGNHFDIIRANLMKNGSGDSTVVVTGLREELRKTEERARCEKDALEGHVKCLKEALHKQEQELERLRSERDERNEAEALRHKEKEKELRQAVESLQTQMQFKEQDLDQMQKKCLALESRLASLQLLSPLIQASTSTGGVTMSQPQGSPQKSPRVRKISVKGPHTPEKGSFPSARSFMSTADVSPQPKGPRPSASVSTGTMTTEDSATRGPLSQQGKNEADSRRSASLKLNIPVVGGRIPILGSQLFHYQCSSRGELEDGGLLGLLQRLPSRLDLTELQYERDHNTERLSPVRKLRRQLSPDSLSKRGHLRQCPKSIVNQEHYLMAVEGLKNLTDPVSWNQKGSVAGLQTGAQCPKDSAVPSTSTVSPQHAAAQKAPLTGPRGAVLFLPLLNDYLKHYIDILSSGGSMQKIGSPVGSTGPSSSTEGSSLDTLSSSLEMLLQQGAEYVNNVETLTLSALRVMHLLVCADEEVRKAVLLSHWSSAHLQAGTSTDTSSSTVETDLDRERVNGSGLEGDDEKSLTSSTASSILSPADSVACPRAMMQGLDILTKLVRLASPSQEVSGFSAHIVETALTVLSALAARLSRAELPRLKVVVLRGILTECLQVQQYPDIVLQALTLFSCLAPARPNVLALCTKNESCTLLNVHLVCLRLVNQFRGKELVPHYVVQLISKVINVLTSLISCHGNGVHILTENNCRCSRQVVPSLVYAMFFLLRDYQLSLSTEVFQVLRKGMLLLHSISLRDPNYQQHHSQVSMHYNPLVLSLARIYKNQPDIPRAEMIAMEDLADEVDDCSSGSQDSDPEEIMVVS